MITPRIENLVSKRLIGKYLSMSLTANKTPALFKSFMPMRKQLAAEDDHRTYEVLLYPPDYFTAFNPNTTFEKWVAVEGQEDQPVSEDMSTLNLPAGLYASFLYRGNSADQQIYQYIFREWLPSSGYLLDTRPHFNVLTEKTKLNNPDSEEEIWIPIRTKE